MGIIVGGKEKEWAKLFLPYTLVLALFKKVNKNGWIVKSNGYFSIRHFLILLRKTTPLFEPCLTENQWVGRGAF